MKIIKTKLYADIKSILEQARNNAIRAVNFSMVIAYWEIGRRIVEEEQGGKKRAGYGEFILKELSQKLISDFGNGFSEQNFRNFRQFYLLFSDNSIRYAVRSKLENGNKSSIRGAVSPE